MSEPQKATGSAFGVGQNEETAEALSELIDAPQTEEQVDEGAQPEVEAAAEESEDDRLLREAAEALAQEEAGQAAPDVSQDLAFTKGELNALKEQIRQMGRAQEIEEPQEGFDLSALEDSPEIAALYEQAKDDPRALARMQGVIAQKVLEAQGDPAKDLKEQLGTLVTAIQQQQRVQHNRQVFSAGLEAARNLGGLEMKLVEQFENSHELAHLDAHIRSGGDPKAYVPKSVLGKFLAGADPSTGQPNSVFAANPTLMQAGVRLLANHLRGGQAASTAGISTTGAAAPVKAASPTADTGEEMTPEQQIVASIMEAAKSRKKAAAFK